MRANEQLVLEAITTNPGLDKFQISRATELSTCCIARWALKLCTEGKVAKARHIQGKKKRLTYYPVAVNE